MSKLKLHLKTCAILIGLLSGVSLFLCAAFFVGGYAWWGVPLMMGLMLAALIYYFIYSYLGTGGWR